MGFHFLIKDILIQEEKKKIKIKSSNVVLLFVQNLENYRANEYQKCI